jgi:ferredoxin
VFGVAGAQIAAPELQATEAAFTVNFVRSGKTATILGSQTLLQVAWANDIQIPSACRQGQCGTCKTRLLNGHVHMTAEHGLDSEAKMQGFVLTCVSHADGNVTLDA